MGVALLPCTVPAAGRPNFTLADDEMEMGGMPLAALKVFGDEINRRTRSMGVALTPCTVPAAGRPNFTLADDEMEMGVGIHGEPGRRRVRWLPPMRLPTSSLARSSRILRRSRGAKCCFSSTGSAQRR